MKEIENYILKYGKVLSNDILKVDSFLNQQIDISLLELLASKWYQEFKDKNITKILTIEASGIALATLTAYKFNVPLVFAKKSKSSNMSDNLYKAKVFSYTHHINNEIYVDKAYLNEFDNILIIDDFLANGEAVTGLINLTRQANAKVVGVGIAIEKGFQKAGDILRSKGLNVKSLAIIDKMDEKTKEIVFREL